MSDAAIRSCRQFNLISIFFIYKYKFQFCHLFFFILTTGWNSIKDHPIDSKQESITSMLVTKSSVWTWFTYVLLISFTLGDGFRLALILKYISITELTILCGWPLNLLIFSEWTLVLLMELYQVILPHKYCITSWFPMSAFISQATN